jgi:hypothetical protein
VIFTFTIEVEVERTEGKFASREDLAGQIVEELESANLNSLTGENDGEYEVIAWDVSEQEQPKRTRKAAAR